MVYLIAMLAGYIDAVGYIELGGYFASFMNGNMTKVAIGMTSGKIDAATPALIVLTFLMSVAVGDIIGEKFAHHRTRVMLALTGAVLGLCWWLVQGQDHTRHTLLILVAAMGLLSTSISGSADRPLGLTYLTGALVRFGHAIADILRGRFEAEEWRFGLLFSMLFLGALGGAFSASSAPHDAIGLAALACFPLAWAARDDVNDQGPESVDDETTGRSPRESDQGN